MLRTGYCGAADWLKEKGIPFETLDRMYLEQEDLDVYKRQILSTMFLPHHQL